MSLFILVACYFVVLQVDATPEPKETAHRIFTSIKPKLAEAERERQFGFLYLQRSEDAGLHYINPDVVSKLGPSAGANERLPALIDADPWPSLVPPAQSNLRVAAPNSVKVPGSNVGHAEQKMLQDFTKMAEGVFGKDGDRLSQCPAFIILGTKLFPCYTSDDVGCGRDFFVTTKSVFDQCTTMATKDSFLYLYTSDNSDNDWHIQKRNFANNGIKIIFGP